MSYPQQRRALEAEASVQPTRSLLMDENLGRADSLLERLMHVNARLQERLERFYGADGKAESSAGPQGWPPGLVATLTGLQQAQGMVLGEIEDKLERIEAL
jgi:hypothetical protein